MNVLCAIAQAEYDIRSVEVVDAHLYEKVEWNDADLLVKGIGNEVGYRGQIEAS